MTVKGIYRRQYFIGTFLETRCWKRRTRDGVEADDVLPNAALASAAHEQSLIRSCLLHLLFRRGTEGDVDSKTWEWRVLPLLGHILTKSMWFVSLSASGTLRIGRSLTEAADPVSDTAWCSRALGRRATRFLEEMLDWVSQYKRHQCGRVDKSCPLGHVSQAYHIKYVESSSRIRDQFHLPLQGILNILTRFVEIDEWRDDGYNRRDDELVCHTESPDRSQTCPRCLSKSPGSVKVIISKWTASVMTIVIFRNASHDLHNDAQRIVTDMSQKESWIQVGDTSVCERRRNHRRHTEGQMMEMIRQKRARHQPNRYHTLFQLSNFNLTLCPQDQQTLVTGPSSRSRRLTHPFKGSLAWSNDTSDALSVIVVVDVQPFHVRGSLRFDVSGLSHTDLLRSTLSDIRPSRHAFPSAFPPAPHRGYVAREVQSQAADFTTANDAVVLPRGQFRHHVAQHPQPQILTHCSSTAAVSESSGGRTTGGSSGEGEEVHPSSLPPSLPPPSPYNPLLKPSSSSFPWAVLLGRLDLFGTNLTCFLKLLNVFVHFSVVFCFCTLLGSIQK